MKDKFEPIHPYPPEANQETLPASEFFPNGEFWCLVVGLIAVVFSSSARTAGLVLIGYWVILRVVKILARALS